MGGLRDWHSYQLSLLIQLRCLSRPDCNHAALDETARCQIEISVIEVSAGWGIRSIYEGPS